MSNLNSVIDFLARVWPQTVVIVGTFVLAVMLIIARRRHPRTAARRRQAQRSTGPIEEVKPQIDRWADVVPADDEPIDRRQPPSGELDDKLRRLEDLVHQADERIAALRELVAVSAGGAGGAAGRPRSSPEPLDPLTRSVYELNDAGRRPVEIAQALDEQVGKIELILALRQG